MDGRAVLWVATVVLTVGCASLRSHKSPAQAEAVEATAARVYAALSANPIYFYRHVEVEADGGVVHLSGYVWTIQALYHAKQIAAGVPGVTRVIDQMQLEREGLRGGGGRGAGS